MALSHGTQSLQPSVRSPSTEAALGTLTEGRDGVWLGWRGVGAGSGRPEGWSLEAVTSELHLEGQVLVRWMEE